MILRIDAGAAIPVYEQIRAQVVRMVIAGTLPPGTRLPTIRQLANDLQVAKGTVAKAYSILERAEVIETRGRRGTFTLPTPDGAAPSFDKASVERELAEAADAYVVAVRQLGLDLDRARAALGDRWPRSTGGIPSAHGEAPLS